MNIEKKVSLQLVGLDGNAFSLMGAFQNQTRREGWMREEIKFVLDDAMSGDYNHLVATLAQHCESPEVVDDEFDDYLQIPDDGDRN